MTDRHPENRSLCPDRELSGRVAVVTGGARNIGRAISESLAAAGASVVVNALHSGTDAVETVSGIEEAGGQAAFFLADVVDPVAVDSLFAFARQRFGPVGILVNCASIRQEWPFEDIRLEDWRRILAITLDGAFNCSQAALPDMKAMAEGAIINIGGETGHTGARERAHVVTAKAGLAGFTKAIALDLAPFGITVNSVVPGSMETPDSRMERHPGSTFRQKRMPPIGRRGQPWEIAEMVRFLCGPRGRYATGQSFHLNGGHSM